MENSVNTLLGQGKFLAPQKKMPPDNYKNKEKMRLNLQQSIMVQFWVVQNEKIYVFNNGYLFC